MTILVGYASKHGATRQIAERIAETLAAAGQPADFRPVEDAGGPLGTETTDTKGRDSIEGALPKELDELLEATAARDHRVFFGALDPDELTLPERALRRLPATRALLPEGDFRDWQDIDAWAGGIARELSGTRPVDT